MVHNTSKTTIWTRFMACMLVVCLTMPSLLMPTAAFADDEEQAQATAANMYYTASAASNYIDLLIGTDTNKAKDNNGDEKTISLNVGNVAGGLGYVDYDQEGIYAGASTTGSSTSNTQSRAYSVPSSDDSTSLAAAAAAYSRYGHGLSELGLDEVSTGYSSGSVLRTVYGGVVYGLWSLSGFVDQVMGWICKGLQAINPFGLLQYAAPSTDTNYSGYDNYTAMGSAESSTISASDWYEGTTDSDAGMIQDQSWYQQVAYTLSSLYMQLQSLSWAVLVPLFLGIAILTWVLGKALFTQPDGGSLGMKGRSGMRNWVVRVLFLVCAVPLLGGIYTGALNAITEQYAAEADGGTISETSLNADALVASQFVDFSSWAEAGHLNSSVFGGSGLQLTSSDASKSIHDDASAILNCSPSSETYGNLRSIVLQINQTYGGVDIETGVVNNLISSTSVGSNNLFNLSKETTTANSNSNSNSDSSHSRIGELLRSYISGDKYRAEDFAGTAYTDLKDNKNVDPVDITYWLRLTAVPSNYALGLEDLADTSAQAYSEHKNTQSDTVFLTSYNLMGEIDSNGTAIFVKGMFNEGTTDTLSSRINAAAEEVVKAKTQNDQAALEAAEEKLADLKAVEVNDTNLQNSGLNNVKWLHDGTMTIGSTGSSNMTITTLGDYGLSTVGMYNYLNTSFAENGSTTVYSSDNTANEASRQYHYAVVSAGTGVFGWLLAGNTILMLGAFVLIGLVYGLGLLFSNIKRGVKALFAVPFAILGMLSSMARFFMFVLMMILDLLVVFFLYQLVCQGLMFINSIIVGMVNTFAPITTGAAVQLAALAVADLVLLFFIIFALRLRTAITGVGNELISRVTNALFQSSGGADAKSNLGRAVLAGGAVGAGLAMKGGGAGALLGGTALAGGVGTGLLAGKGLLSAQADGAAENAGGNDSSVSGETSDTTSSDAQSMPAAFTGGIEGGNRAMTGNMSGSLTGDDKGVASAITGEQQGDSSLSDASASAQGGTATQQASYNPSGGLASAYSDAMGGSAASGDDAYAEGAYADQASINDAYADSAMTGDAYADGGQGVATSQAGYSLASAMGAAGGQADSLYAPGAGDDTSLMANGYYAQGEDSNATPLATAAAGQGGVSEADAVANGLGYGAGGEGGLGAIGQSAAAAGQGGYGQGGLGTGESAYGTPVSAESFGQAGLANAESGDVSVTPEGRADNLYAATEGIGAAAYAEGGTVNDANIAQGGTGQAGDVRGVSVGEAARGVDSVNADAYTGDVEAQATGEGGSAGAAGAAGSAGLSGSSGIGSAVSQQRQVSEMNRLRAVRGASAMDGSAQASGEGGSVIDSSRGQEKDMQRVAKPQPMGVGAARDTLTGRDALTGGSVAGRGAMESSAGTLDSSANMNSAAERFNRRASAAASVQTTAPDTGVVGRVASGGTVVNVGSAVQGGSVVTNSRSVPDTSAVAAANAEAAARAKAREIAAMNAHRSVDV